MNYYVKTVNYPRSIGCTIKAEANLQPEIEGDCPLLPISVVYGVCRVFCKSTILKDKLIPISYLYRLPHKNRRGGKKTPNSCVLWVDLPAKYLTLKNKKVRARVLVSGEGITVTRILVTAPETPFNPFRWEKVVTLKAS